MQFVKELFVSYIFFCNYAQGDFTTGDLISTADIFFVSTNVKVNIKKTEFALN